MGASRVVVKIGSSSLTDPVKGGLDRSMLDAFVEMMSRVRASGGEVVLVTSGAVSSGFAALGYKSKPREVRMKQAAAAVGQGLLMQAYYDAFSRRGIVAAQVLLTRAELSRRRAFDNAFNTMEELLARGAVPIINENDSVAVDELTFGDNDILSAYVAGLVHADLLVILTDTNGLYESDPRSNPGAVRIERLSEVTPEIVEMCGGAGSNVGTGGMRAKVVAARQALEFGVPVFIGRSDSPDALVALAERREGNGTFIGASSGSSLPKKRQWTGLHGKVEGVLLVDDGAARALGTGKKSLLPAGIRGIEGSFGADSLVEVRREADRAVLGRGVCAVSSEEVRTLSTAAREGRAPRGVEIIHRNEWVGVEPEADSLAGTSTEEG